MPLTHGILLIIKLPAIKYASLLAFTIILLLCVVCMYFLLKKKRWKCVLKQMGGIFFIYVITIDI